LTVTGVMAPEELRGWLRLLLVPQIGRGTARRLLAAFGTPQAVFEASPDALRAVVTAKQAATLGQPIAELDGLLQATTAWLNAGEVSAPRHIITLGDAMFPSALLETADPPLMLYAQGNLDLLHRFASTLAMVGSRNPTPQGLDTARSFAEQASRAGLTVVSGLALGIDGAAHEGALSGAAAGQAATIAVVGTGLDRVYPSRHLKLAHRIAAQGLMLSEYPIGTPPLPPNFPLRNRIIAGLARATLVVEAALPSGSLITAKQALEAGRDVLAIPGSIHSPLSRGCHMLIKQGAKLVDSAQDVLEEFGQVTAPKISTLREHGEPIEQPLLEALGYDPVSLDALSARTGRSAADLNGALLELELEGHLKRLPGQLFQRCALA
jgi:DNA processing protein